MHLGAVGAALRGAAGEEGTDAGNLRHALEVEHGVVDRVVGRHVHNRIVGFGKDFADLVLPDLPGVRPPEVVHPEKAALQEIGPEPGRILLAEVQTSDLLHQDHGTAVELVVGEPHDQMVGLARGVEADADFGQLGEPDREIDVGERVIGEPTPAVTPRIHAIDGAAIVKSSVEAVRPCQVRVDAAVGAAELPRGETGGAERDRQHDGQDAKRHRVEITAFRTVLNPVSPRLVFQLRSAPSERECLPRRAALQVGWVCA